MLTKLIYFNLNNSFLSARPIQQPFRVTRNGGVFEAINYPATVLPFPLKATHSCAFVTSRF